MGKYTVPNDIDGFSQWEDEHNNWADRKVEFLMYIADELAEANRLKRIEIFNEMSNGEWLEEYADKVKKTLEEPQ